MARLRKPTRADRRRAKERVEDLARRVWTGDVIEVSYGETIEGQLATVTIEWTEWIGRKEET